jgi:hypothetical protein
MSTRQSVYQAAIRLGVDTSTALAASERIGNGSVTLLGFSGKLASGKDSVAAGVVANLGLERTLHLSFAHALKEEVDETIKLARASRWADIATIMGLSDPVSCAEYLRLLEVALAEQPDVDARTRTSGIRRVLQFWGTEIRRAQQYDYWVRKAAQNALSAAAAGTHVFFTDGRFPNEIAASQQLGFIVIRLEVSPEVQAQRLAQRDGLVPDPDSLLHPSEVALDDYANFDLVTSNDGRFEDTVMLVSNWVRSQSETSEQ